MAPHTPIIKRVANRISSVIKANGDMSIVPMTYCTIRQRERAIGVAMLIAHAKQAIVLAAHQKAAKAAATAHRLIMTILRQTPTVVMIGKIGAARR